MVKKTILISLFVIKSSLFFTQVDSTHFLNFYYGLGVANPAGSFSKNSDVYNNFGKMSPGLNMKAGMEYLINSKNAISFDLDYAFFFNATNDSLSKQIKRRVDSYGIPYIDASDDGIDVSIAQVALGYSRLFNFKKFTLQAKICLGSARFGYDYIGAYGLTNALTATTSISLSNISLASIDYSFNDYNYYTVKPELIFKTILQKRKYADLALSFGVGYFYAKPNMALLEHKDGKTTEVLKLKDKINVININVTLNLILKRTLFDSFK
jgi:hypothetical protein